MFNNHECSTIKCFVEPALCERSSSYTVMPLKGFYFNASHILNDIRLHYQPMESFKISGCLYFVQAISLFKEFCDFWSVRDAVFWCEYLHYITNHKWVIRRAALFFFLIHVTILGIFQGDLLCKVHFLHVFVFQFGSQLLVKTVQVI